jgi:NADH-quinone oxidoreductase subunit G
VTDVSPRATEETVSFILNGKEVTARPGEQLIDACDRNGVYIPRFCYHPRMTAVGKCRQCIVEVDTGRGMQLQASCMIAVSPGMAVETESELSKQVQEGVLEHLLINHPLDCPVCDKGGECPLQDQAYSHGPGESRFVEQKRHFEKPIAVSDLVYLDRERCILCDRCTRFADEVAGDPLIHFISRGNATQVNTFPDDPFASYFSGNTVQICPVGALTAVPYRFKARPWDLETAESTCQSCSVGCRVSIDTSRNRVLRVNGVDSDPVNWGWLCDAGRFNFESIHHDDRLGAPLVRRDGELVGATWSEALGAATAALRHSLDGAGAGSIAVLGGARLTNEDAYAWAKFAKGVLGTDHVDAQLGDGLPGELVLGLPRATIDRTCAKGGTVLVLGTDLKEELPVLYLRLRHAVVNDGVRLVEVTPAATGLTRYASRSVHPTPGHTAEVVRAVLDGLTGKAVGGVEPADLVGLADALRDGGPLTVVVGRGSLAESAALTVDAAAVLHDALPDARFLPVLRRSNVFGALDMGLAPGILPGRVALDEGRQWYAAQWPTVPTERGRDATGILTAAADGHMDTLVLLGADPIVDFPDADLAARALAGARTVIALDRFVTESVARADVVFPVAGYAECDGTTTNLEGRVSRLAKRVTAPGTARSDWTLAVELAERLGHDLGFVSVPEIWAEIEAVSPAHRGITTEVLSQPGNADGVLAPPTEAAVTLGRTVEAIGDQATDEDGADVPPSDPDAPGDTAPSTTEAVEPSELAADTDAAAEVAEEVAAEVEDAVAEESDAEASDAASDPAASAAGRPALLQFVAPDAASAPGPDDAYALRLVTSRTLYDQGTLVAHSPSLAPIAPGPSVGLNPVDFDKVGVPAGSDVRVTSSAGAIVVPIQSDPSVPRGRASVLVNQDGPRITELLDATAAAIDVRIEVP